MGIFRHLIISFVILACITPLAAQTKQLPEGCMYMQVVPFQPLKNPFSPPVLSPPMPFSKDGINLTRIVVPPQFRVRNLPAGSEAAANRRAETAAQQLGIVCGTIRFH
jgi:hypothetical protein